MKNKRLVLIVLVLASFTLAGTAFASNGDPAGSCPGNFELHPFMDHEGHEDHHIGLTQDLNGDGWICVKHLPDGLHVHMDNVLPLP